MGQGLFGVVSATQPFATGVTKNHSVNTADLLNTSGGIVEQTTYGATVETTEEFYVSSGFANPCSGGIVSSGAVVTQYTETQVNTDYVKGSVVKREGTGA